MGRALRIFVILLLLSLPVFVRQAGGAKPGLVAQVLAKDGRVVEGGLSLKALHITVDGTEKSAALANILSVHTGDAASPTEAEHISAGLKALAGEDLAVRETILAELTDIGLPVITPLLALLDPNDTDIHEPHPLYSLFARIMPAGGDRLDRSPDLIRMVDGSILRGKLLPVELRLTVTGGKTETVPLSSVRRLAVRRDKIDRNLDIHSLRHSTQIEWLDTGIALTSDSKMESAADGITRLSFNLDKWTATPDGLIRPDATGQKRVIDGFNFGALLLRIGGAGPRQMAGKHVARTDLGTGRLYFAINDNGHWQNNIGSYRLRVHVTNAYDVGDAQ
jgi:hypothetical protein